MAATQRRIRYEVDGTAARAYAVPERQQCPPYTRGNQPAREQWVEEEKVRRRVEELEERNLERERRMHWKVAPLSAAPAVDRFAMVVLTVSIILTFAVAVSYLQMLASISNQNKEIARLESKTEALMTSNDILERRISDSIDLAEIQTIAMEELGMVYPYQDQLITYDTGSRGYVRQYGELLGNEEQTTTEILMGMILSLGENGVTLNAKE